jgi:predicted lactoylglutathione lyase
MASKVFINLPVKDLNRSMDFFKELGYHFNEQFTDDKGACMVISENIFVMLLVNDYFRSFSNKAICNTQQENEVLIALDCNSRSEVEDTISKAIALGGGRYNQAQDHGWMYQDSFTDLDGHHWEYAYMDISMLPNTDQ